MTIDLKPWDAAEILTREEPREAYLEDAFESHDVAIIDAAVATVARARAIQGG